MLYSALDHLNGVKNVRGDFWCQRKESGMDMSVCAGCGMRCAYCAGEIFDQRGC